MSAIMLDTSVCVRVLRDRSGFLSERFKAHIADLGVSTAVVTELMFGAAVSDRRDHHMAEVKDLVRRIHVLDFDQDAAEHAADIRAYLRRAGTPIGTYDTLIAAHARSEGALLLTGNLAHFNRVPGLRCDDWTEQ